MSRQSRPILLPLVLSVVLAGAGAATAPLLAQEPAPTAPAVSAWAATERAMGRAGQLQPDGAMKFSFPRSDLAVTVGDVHVRPALALGGWVAFRQTAPGRAMAMGDLVLTEDEVGPVMSALQAGGVDATALHNHLSVSRRACCTCT